MVRLRQTLDGRYGGPLTHRSYTTLWDTTTLIPISAPPWPRKQLSERDGIVVSLEMVRRIQTRLELHRPKKRGEKRVFQVRDRRRRSGELVQIDGSPHDWLEGRGPRCTLIVFIDDATSRLMALHFMPSETTRAYLETLGGYVLTHARFDQEGR